VPAPHSAICPQLIGRGASLHAVAQRVKRLSQGYGGALLISGEAGIGKSRLVAEVKATIRRDALLVLQGNCFEPDRALPYGPLIDAIRGLLAHHTPSDLLRQGEPYATELAQLFPELADDAGDAVGRMTHPTGSPGRPEQEKRRLFEALTLLFTRLSAQRPIVLVAEDIHWADDTSLEFFEFFTRRAAHLPVLLLLTYRSDEQHPRLQHLLAQFDRERLATEIALMHLSPAEVEEMLQAIFQLQRPIRHEFVDTMYSLTEGNPFFIEEVLHALLADDEIYWGNDSWERKPLQDLHIPRSVRDAVRRRSEQLSPQARQMMWFAAVVGQRFEFALLQYLTGHDEATLLALLKELIAAQLVVEQSAERFAFRHALTRESVCAELLEREKRTMHRSVAAALETLYPNDLESRLSELAYHTCNAGEWERALGYARRAGERALALYAPHAALAQLSQAVNAARHLKIPVAPAVYRERASAYAILGDFEYARNDLELAIRLADECGDSSAEWEALLDLGLLWAGRDYTKSGDCFQRALTLVNTFDNSVCRARTLNRLANWHLNVDEPSIAKARHEEALAIFGAAGDTRGVAQTLDLLCMASLLSGDLDGGARYGERAVDLLRALDDRQLLSSSLITLPFAAALRQSQTMALAPTTLAEAAREAQEGLHIARDMGWRAGEASALWVLGLCMSASGQFGAGLKSAASSLAIAEEIEHRQWITAALYTHGELFYELSSLALAREHLERGLALARAIGSWHWIRLNAALLASTCLAQGDLAAAEAALDTGAPAETAMRTAGQRLAWVARGDLALTQGNAAAALEIATRLVDGASAGEARRMPLVALLRGRALMALDRFEEANEWLYVAEATLRAQGVQTTLRRVLTEQTALSQRLGRAEDAARSAAEARTLSQRMAETIPDAVLRAVFMRQTLACLPSGVGRAAEGTRAASGMLTARESEVAALVAQGGSNRAIAAELVVSERTVESHVTNILGKLGFTSRAQIAAWAVDIGLAQARVGHEAQSTRNAHTATPSSPLRSASHRAP
jgi:DNA-binding CsgD family transcriptional regulator/tetratricopeptide (TPR) repeat protein